MSRGRIWAVIPAAGTGSRMGADIPKQYLQLCGYTVLEHTLQRFCDHPDIEGVVVAIAQDDEHWPTLGCSSHPAILRAVGGHERVHSVLNGLDLLLDTSASEHDWVLVHDAARPCVRPADISRLIDEVSQHAVGGLLAWPVRDTLKRADDTGDVQVTVDRSGLWHALTPQMFRLGELSCAIRSALERGQVVTDEAQAMELSNRKPKLVQGSPDNIKITLGADMAMAELYIKAQSEQTSCE